MPAYEVDLWGKIRRANEAARARCSRRRTRSGPCARRWSRRWPRPILELLELDYELEIAQRTYQARTNSLVLTVAREEGGVAAMQDVAQAKILVYGAEASIVDIQRQREQQENVLCILLGRNPGPIQRGEGFMAQHVRAEVPAGLPSSLLERRPDIRFAEEQLVAANANIGEAKAAGAELGAEFVLVTGNDADEVRACENYAALCDLAATFALRPMLEFITWRPLRNIGQAARWLRRAARPAGGICIDALHLFRSGGTIADVRQADPSDIGYVQLSDAATLEPAERFSEGELMHEARNDRRLPGQGVLPLAAFMRALRPGLAISIEAPCAAHAHLSVEERALLAMEATRPVLRDYLARPLNENGPERRA